MAGVTGQASKRLATLPVPAYLLNLLVDKLISPFKYQRIVNNGF